LNETADQSGAPETAPGEPPHAKRRRRGFLACLAGLGAGLAGLAASRLGQLWVGFDVFAQCTLQFAVITAAFLVGLAMPRGRVLTALVLAMLGGLVIGIWPYWASRERTAGADLQPGEIALRLASFNIWDGNRNEEAVRAEIIRLDADVIAVVEAQQYGRHLADSLRTQYAYRADCFDDPLCDSFILSKHPIAAHQYKLFWEGPPMVVAQLGPELGNVTVVAVHTLRFPHSRAQLHQVQGLAKWLEKVAGSRIVMGDFNSTPFSRMLTALSGATGMKRLTELPTWPAWFGLPQVAIDHIFVSEGIRPVSREQIGNPSGSDHFPISLTVAVPVG
jgi:endonuclease/exonuclease/phosphatase (EEP) superfamily protein YafD